MGQNETDGSPSLPPTAVPSCLGGFPSGKAFTEKGPFRVVAPRGLSVCLI